MNFAGRKRTEFTEILDIYQVCQTRCVCKLIKVSIIRFHPRNKFRFFTPIPMWFILWEYLPYFYITHIVIEVGITLMFFWYVYSYALYVWRPFWKFEVWRRFRNNPNKRQQALRDLNHSLKYALMKVYIFWSWNGYDRNRHLLPQENEQ